MKTWSATFGKLAVLGLTALAISVGSRVLGSAQDTKPAGPAQVGRFQIISAEHPSMESTGNGRLEKTVDRILIKLDTATGETWEFRHVVIVGKDNTMLRQETGWSPIIYVSKP